MADARTCIGCNKTMEPKQLASHHQSCKPWQKWLEENKAQILEEAITNGRYRTAKKYSLDMAHLGRMLVAAGLLKPEELPPSYTKKYPKRHKKVRGTPSPAYLPLILPSKQKYPLIFGLLEELRQLVSELEEREAEAKKWQAEASKYAARLTEVQNLLARRD